MDYQDYCYYVEDSLLPETLVVPLTEADYESMDEAYLDALNESGEVCSMHGEVAARIPAASLVDVEGV